MKLDTEISVVYKHDTKLAVLVKDGDNLVWIPKSAIVNRDDMDWNSIEKDDEINLEVPEWFAVGAGLV